MANVETLGSKRRRSDFQTIGLVALLAALLCPSLEAESPGDRIQGVYRGTIGQQQIVLEFSEVLTYEYGTNYDDPDDWRTYPISGSYFYRRYGVSIDLAGMPLPDGSLRIREYLKLGFSPYEFPAEWRLTVGRDAASGIFCKCDLSGPAKPAGPVLKITLKRISDQPPPPEQWEHYRVHSGNTYYDLLLDYPLNLGPERQADPTIAYRMRTDRRFDISRPKLTRFPDRRAMARINAGLTAEFNQTRLKAASCFSAGRIGGAYGGWYNEAIKLSVLPPYVLGVLVQSSCYSGGAHPNEGIYTLNYDLHTGHTFTLEDSFRAPEGEDAELEMAAVLANLYQRHYVEPPPVQTPEDCDVVLLRNTSGNVSLKNAFSPRNAKLFLTKNGLVIIPIFATRPEMGCAPPVTVPYRELRPYVKKDSLLYWVVERPHRRQ